MELELTAEELRVLACLVEKSFTTPDQYPLTTNALTNACNQKTSRDPVVDYPSQLVDRIMLSLRDGGWARSVRGTGNRAFKHKHVIDERLGVSTAEQAVLAVLALRGPQSPGELRTRTERYGAFPADGDEAFVAIEHTLEALAGREPPLVRNIGRASGQSQDRWIQLLDETGIDQSITPASTTASADPDLVSGPAPTGSTLPASAVGSAGQDVPAVALAVAESAGGGGAPSSVHDTDQVAIITELLDRIARLEERVDDLEELLT